MKYKTFSRRFFAAIFLLGLGWGLAAWAADPAPPAPAPPKAKAAPAPAPSKAKPTTAPAPAAQPAPTAPAHPGGTPAVKPETKPSEESWNEQHRSERRQRNVRRGPFIGGHYTVKRGETVRDELVCIGCRLEIDGEVDGDLVAVGGKVKIDGTVKGDSVLVFSDTKIADDAEIGGEITNVGGSLDLDNPKVNGEITNIGGWSWPWKLFGFSPSFSTFGWLWAHLISLALAIGAILLVTLLFPDRVRLMAEETPTQPVVSFFAGVAGYFGAILFGIALFCSCIGWPLIPVWILLFQGLKFLGMAAVFLVLGRRLAKALDRELSLLGTVVLGMLPVALISLVPCFGGVLWALIKVMGVGLAVLTHAGARPIQFGAQRSTPPAAPATAAPPPSVPPVPPPPGPPAG